ncbi:MAG: hypothetical protein K8R69_07180 [Deltaproteobacteria bacterium]|nr:hypothetical protein [Deltaproteobacteria bacterium]
MKKILPLALVLISLSSFTAKADTTTTTTTTGNTTKTTNVENGIPTTHIHQSDDPAVGDPVGGRGVSARDDRGPANTQKLCEDGSSDPDCARAEKRQTSKTTWQEDCASGATKGCTKPKD